MLTTIHERVRTWAQTGADANVYYGINQQIEFLTSRLFSHYLPTNGPSHLSFQARLRKWLDNAPDADQQLLFQLVPSIFFVGRNEFTSLYRTAFNDIVLNWLIDQDNLVLDDDKLQLKLAAAVRETWFCGITDSMQISDFYHVNNITVNGPGHRPSWASLHKLGNTSQLSNYFATNGLKRLVLLEDFVGSGTQMCEALTAWSDLSSPVPLLIIPLLACPSGCERGRLAESKSPEITFSPVLELPANTFVAPTARPSEPTLFQEIRDLVVRHARNVQGGVTRNWYGEFGYPQADPIGGLVVMYSNCPDTSLPLLHFTSPSWTPLFPRTSRV